jgi:hypothetical protein
VAPSPMTRVKYRALTVQKTPLDSRQPSDSYRTLPSTLAPSTPVVAPRSTATFAKATHHQAA